jgi:hypothetical protein
MELSSNNAVKNNEKNPGSGSISYSEVESIIQMALKAPTGDNSQHWRFTWNDNTLAIFYDEILGRHALNNNNHATWLALGCILETIKISASGLRLKVSEELNFENSKTRPAAVVTLHRSEVHTDPLISEISTRRTDRIPFLKEPIAEEMLGLLNFEASKFKSCQFSLSQSTPIDILDYLIFCDEFMWKNTKIAKDFFSWVRLNEKEISLRPDGMQWFNLGLKKSELAPIRFFRKFPHLIKLFWNFGFSRQINRMTESLSMSQGALYCIAIEDTNPKAVSDVGRLAIRCWLQLNSEGYGVQPLSIPSMTAFDIMTGYPPPHTGPLDIETFKRNYPKLKKFFNFSEKQFPVWMFRTGKLPHDIQQLDGTPRVTVSERLKVYTRWADSK